MIEYTNKELAAAIMTKEVIVAAIQADPAKWQDVIKEIGSVHRDMTALLNPAPISEAAPEKQQPAVPIKKSVQPDAIICLEDGKRFKSLRRHLMTAYGMTPQAYRAKWGLPKDYPMVAPEYAAARSVLAKNLGLGRKAPRSLTPLTPVQSEAMTKASVAPKKIGRPRKTPAPIITAKATKNGRTQHAHG